MKTNISLRERTADNVKICFEKANTPEIKRVLPLKATTIEEALEDYERTLLPGSNSYGQTIYVDEKYIGDIWCYCIDLNEEPNCMLSYCIFDKNYWSQGIATEAVKLFSKKICKNYLIKSIGAFTYSENIASIKVLEKNGFEIVEEFEEGGIRSKFLIYRSISGPKLAECHKVY